MSDDNYNPIEDLYRLMKSERRVAYMNSDRSELSVRCPYCGDSAKDKTHAHFYISTKSPFYFFCQRCETTGAFNSEALEDIGCHDDELGVALNKEIKRKFRDRTVRSGDMPLLAKSQIKLPKYDLGGDFAWKLKYIEERMGLRIGRNELRQHRIINSASDFLILNGMEKLLDDEKMERDCYLVDKYGLGWLSRDASHMTFRFIRGDFKKRFKTICIDPYRLGSKIFTIPSPVEKMARNVNLVMTEGFFDLWGVHSHIFQGKTVQNRILAAINGKGINLFPKMLMRSGYLDIDLEIYSDNDVSTDKYEYLLDMDRYNSIKIHYNVAEGEKDFGVRKEQIRCKTFRLK